MVVVAAAAAVIVGAACGGGDQVATRPSAAFASVRVEAPVPAYVGTTVGLRAIATRTDGTVANVTLSAAWSSSDSAVAGVSSDGRVTVHAAGRVEISAVVAGLTGRAALDTLDVPVVTGRVTDRIEGGPIDGSTIYFDGPASRSTAVRGGRYEIALLPGAYQVSIAGPSHVEHQDRSVDLSVSRVQDFTVLKWGSSRFGAVYDEGFHRFFHQVARVWSGSGAALHKWIVPLDEVYVVDAGLPEEHMQRLMALVAELSAADLPALWCGLPGGLRIRRGPATDEIDGRILVVPAHEGGWTGTHGVIKVRSGRVTVSTFNRTHQRPYADAELRAGLLHEFYHVAFGYHLCGGNLGSNPFGFGPGNCPYPDSVMANNGILVPALSPQDRLAACLVNHPDTTPGNALPDINR